jgi:hypothetical protein
MLGADPHHRIDVVDSDGEPRTKQGQQPLDR